MKHKLSLFFFLENVKGIECKGVTDSSVFLSSFYVESLLF